jgi:regulator of replication initiation timing
MSFSQGIIISWILVNMISADSLLTDSKLESCPSVCLNHSTNLEISNLRQQLNQESLIRLSLTKQVYTLVSDMIAIKQKIAGVFVEGRQFEDKLEAMEKTMEVLRSENKILRSELEQRNFIGANATEFVSVTADLFPENSSNSEG